MVESSLSGYEVVDYVFGARQGQYIRVSMATDNAASYFNILAPGEEEVAIFNGSVAENRYQRTLAEDGEYTIRVYLMRSAARRDEVADYRLDLVLRDRGEDPAGQDAMVPGTGYHATGTVPCSMGGGQPARLCPFGVTREGYGNGTVTVTKPGGRTRSIFFKNGRAIGYDVNQADPGAFRADREADLIIVHIGNERYEIPDAVIFGG